MNINSDDGKMAISHSNHTQTVEELPRPGKDLQEKSQRETGQGTNKLTQGSKSASSEAVQETFFPNDGRVPNSTGNRGFLVAPGVMKKTEVRVHLGIGIYC